MMTRHSSIPLRYDSVIYSSSLSYSNRSINESIDRSMDGLDVWMDEPKGMDYLGSDRSKYGRIC